MLLNDHIKNKVLLLKLMYVCVLAFVLAFSLPESRGCPPIPLNLKEVSQTGLQSEK